MPSEPLLDQIASLHPTALRDPIAGSVAASNGLIRRLIGCFGGHLAAAGWSWLTIVLCVSPPAEATGDGRRTGT